MIKKICLHWGNGIVTEFYVSYKVLRAIKTILVATDCQSAELDYGEDEE